MSRNRRKSIRLKYPIKDRPQIGIKGRGYPIIDISLTGMKFRYTAGISVPKGTQIEAPVQFGDRAQLTIKGTVVRVLGDLIMINFAKPIDRKILSKEADYLLEKYGKLDAS